MSSISENYLLYFVIVERFLLMAKLYRVQEQLGLFNQFVDLFSCIIWLQFRKQSLLFGNFEPRR